MNEALMADLLGEARKTNEFLAFLAFPAILDLVRLHIRNESEARIYLASTGGSSREVGSTAGVAHTTVQDAWTRWLPRRLVVPAEAPGRFRRLEAAAPAVEAVIAELSTRPALASPPKASRKDKDPS